MDWRPDSSMSKIEVDCAKSVNLGNLNLPLRDDRANKGRKSHLLCAFVPDPILGNSFTQFIQFSPNSNRTDIVILFQDEDAKDPKRSFLPKVI